MLPPREFVRTFSLTKPITRQLMEELRPFIHFTTIPMGPTSSKLESWMHCMGRNSVGNCIEEVTEALNRSEVQKKWIKFPKTKKERDAKIASKLAYIKICTLVMQLETYGIYHHSDTKRGMESQGYLGLLMFLNSRHSHYTRK